MKKMLLFAATALFMVGGAFAQTAVAQEDGTVAVAQEEMSAAVVEKKCDKKAGKKSLMKASKFKAIPGHGVEAVVGSKKYYFGNMKLH